MNNAHESDKNIVHAEQKEQPEGTLLNNVKDFFRTVLLGTVIVGGTYGYADLRKESFKNEHPVVANAIEGIAHNMNAVGQGAKQYPGGM